LGFGAVAQCLQNGRRMAGMRVITVTFAIFFALVVVSETEASPRRIRSRRSVPLFLAHRGGNVGPEGVIGTYRQSLALGFGIEGDLHETADGHIVNIHDPSGLRTTGVDRLVRETTLAELKTWDAGHGFVDEQGRRPFAGHGLTIPTLEELLDAFPKTPMNLDIKPVRPSIVKKVVHAIRERNAEDHITLASFHFRTVLELRLRGYRGRVGLSTRELYSMFVPNLYRLMPVPGDVAQFPLFWNGRNLGQKKLIDRCHACALDVHFWDVDTVAEGQRLLDLGVDVIETNQPRLLQSLL
jgi:glycerophosphoryl diester phosphodiesterase